MLDIILSIVVVGAIIVFILWAFSALGLPLLSDIPGLFQ